MTAKDFSAPQIQIRNFNHLKNVSAVEDADDAMYNRNDDRALVNDWYNGNVPANVLEPIDSLEAGQNIQPLIAKGDRSEPVSYSNNSQLGAEIGKAIKKGTVAIRDMLGQEVSLMTTVGAYALDMNVDGDGIYHADFDCWQSAFGYNDFYEKIGARAANYSGCTNTCIVLDRSLYRKYNAGFKGCDA